jgi:SAM-dependent methyltransferase
MDLKEIQNFSSQTTLVDECRHWWIATRFHYIDQALEALLTRPGSFKQQFDVLEFGCGTGQNLFYLRHLSSLRHQIRRQLGTDMHLPDNVSPDWTTSLDQFSRELPATTATFDLLLAMDVLEHIEDHLGALNEWKKFMSDRSLLLVTVPAFQSLWSYHDELLEHKRRYTRSTLLQVTEQAGLRPVFLNYAFGPFFPLVYVIRKLQANKNRGQTDLKMPPALINEGLHWIGKVEALFGGNPYFGTSLVGIFQRT